jgi:hypothetical protein
MKQTGHLARMIYIHRSLVGKLHLRKTGGSGRKFEGKIKMISLLEKQDGKVSFWGHVT